ncbi:MAG: General transcription factor 3C polypeptide 5, partial [Marteilia pararefringens]
KKQDSVDDSDTVKADGYYSATRIRFSDDKVPESLFQETIDRILCRTKENRKIYEAIIKKFDEQPIWSTNELILTLRTSVPIELKHMGFFRKVAYKFFDGPFMNLWIKKGYDPRINRSAAIYQVVPVRLKHKIRGFDSSRGNELGNVYVNTNSIPTLMCILYQYKNIDLAEAKQLLDNVIGEGDTCSYEDGWLLPGTTRKCSEIITRQIVHNYNSQFKD